MERELDPRLKELYDAKVPVYSISRLDCINRCLYEAYCTYVLHAKQKPNVYSSLGGKMHDVLEGIVNGKNTEADLLEALAQELEDLDLLQVSFPKDVKGGDSIREGWIADMTHFCNTYHSPRGTNLKTEELFIYTSPAGHKLQGYIDLQKVRPDGSIDIYDYKTSALYRGNDLQEHARQLIVYALGLEQAGKKVNSVSWVFLKYVEIVFQGYKTVKSRHKTEIRKAIERRKIAQEMRPYVERDMQELGYDEIDIEAYLTVFVHENDFNVLPDNVKALYTMQPYVLTAHLTPETKAECEQYIDNTIAKWEALGAEEKAYTPCSFTKMQKNGKEVLDVFYCTSLCGHYHHCHHAQEFIAAWNAAKNEDENALFA